MKPADAPIVYPVQLYLYRYMFNDGSTFDVIAPSENSDVREWVLKQHANKSARIGISGIANLGPIILEGDVL